MKAEDLKFRFYNGEKTCPIEERPYKDGPYILRTFWDLERYIARSYGVNGIIDKFKELYVPGGEFAPKSLCDLDVPDGEKAVFVTCCQCVDTNLTPAVDDYIVDMYFNNGVPHAYDIPER